MLINTKNKAAKPIQSAAGTFKVAGIQMASSPNVASNLTEAKRLIALAAEQGAKIVVLPEYFCIMGLKEIDKVAVREKPNDGPIQKFLAKMARDYKIWLIGGTVPIISNFPNKVRNSCLVYNDKGEQVARYDKISPIWVRSWHRTLSRRKYHRIGQRSSFGGYALWKNWFIGVLRFALSRVISRHGPSGYDCDSIGVYRNHRQSALGVANTRACD